MDKPNTLPKSDFDPKALYPEAEPIFGFKLQHLQEIKEEADIVLDTNALLVPYTVGKQSLKEIEKTYRMLIAQKRLIIPGQVAREFAKHRATKLADLFQQLSVKRDSIQTIDTGSYPLLDDFKEYKELLKLQGSINDQIKEYRKATSALLERIQEWTWDDPVSVLYGKLFKNDVIFDPDYNGDDIKEEQSKRKAGNIPPGYKDPGPGDLIIWLTILKLAEQRQHHLVFASGDEKADWYHQSNKGALYPRYELVDEFRRHSKGKSFHIIPFSMLLDLYGANTKVIEEVRKEETFEAYERALLNALERQQSSHFGGRGASSEIVKEAVAVWLKQQKPGSTVTPTNDDRLDFILEMGTERAGVIVRYLSDTHGYARRGREIIAAIQGLEQVMLFIVAEDLKLATDFTRLLKVKILRKHIIVPMPATGRTVTIGYLEGSNFVPVLESHEI